ncbi:MAG: tRNA epoxyqueuosine(34) reductase QueG [Brevinematia bacterium]
MKEKIKEVALESGFDLVSFVSSESILKNTFLFSKYSEWIRFSLNANMKYLDIPLDKKFNPASIEGWARSIILVGASYFNSSNFDLPSEEYGRVSMYAWGQDYHFVLKKMLEEFVQKLKFYLGREFRYRIFSDATPLYEKGFAVAGGMGFQGKNTCVINPKYGSFFFIGEVLTDLDLGEDEPIEFKGCGGCSLCIDSCPTSALTPYVLDARKCISYLTIEYRGIIPEDLAFKMGDWIFGCDICQRVCPFNKWLFVKKFVSKIREFNINLTPFLSLRDVMSIPSNNQFKKTFYGKAFLRAGRSGLIRNAIIVAVNNKAYKLIDKIKELADDSNEVISETAKWAIKTMSG